MEEAYKHEKEIKEAIEHVAEMCSFYSLKDALDADADESTENRLLPAANKVWPFLVACIRNKSPLVSGFLTFFWKLANHFCIFLNLNRYLTIFNFMATIIMRCAGGSTIGN